MAAHVFESLVAAILIFILVLVKYFYLILLPFLSLSQSPKREYGYIMMTCIGLLRLLSWEAGSSGVVQDICPKYLLVWGRRNIFIQNICHIFKQARGETLLAGPNAINFLQTVQTSDSATLH